MMVINNQCTDANGGMLANAGLGSDESGQGERRLVTGERNGDSVYPLELCKDCL